MPLLEAHGLAVNYGGICAVRGVDFKIEEGEWVCLIGANGAGKTTTLKALTGLVQVAAGHLRFNGALYTHRPAHRIAQAGIALVPEGRGVFARMTVAENLDIGAYLRRDRPGITHDLARVYALFPRLAERRAQPAGTLSGGEQQMLALGRALMSRPRLLLLDEPSMGLAPLMVRTIFAALREISRQGVTLFLVEQNVRLALAVSHRGDVMEIGTITLAGAAAQLAADASVQHAYLGRPG